MVTETRETMTKMFDAMAETARNTVEMGCRFQESWLDNMKSAWKGQGADQPPTPNADWAKDWWPFVGRNVQAAADTCDIAMKSGLSVVRKGCELTKKADGVDFYADSREMWDAGFEACRTNVDAFTKFGKLAAENWATFCKDAFGSSTSGKTSNKPSSPK